MLQVLIAHPNVLYANALSSTIVELDMIDSAHSLNSTSVQEILQETRRLCPAILVVPSAPADLGAAVARQISAVRPGTQLIVIDLADDDAAVLRLIELGMAGYQIAGTPIEDLVASVVAVARGETLCSPRIARQLFRRLAQHAQGASGFGANEPQDLFESREPARLTRREIDIVERIERGLANKEIARDLGIEVQTVKNHVHNVLQKLQVRDRRGAVRFARRHGLMADRQTPMLIDASCAD